VHPEILQAYAEGDLLLQVKATIEDELRNDLPKLSPEEAAVLALLEARLSRTLKDKLQDSVALLRKSKRNGKGPAKRHNGRSESLHQPQPARL
jgi:DNA topoisomerase-1